MKKQLLLSIALLTFAAQTFAADLAVAPTSDKVANDSQAVGAPPVKASRGLASVDDPESEVIRTAPPEADVGEADLGSAPTIVPVNIDTSANGSLSAELATQVRSLDGAKINFDDLSANARRLIIQNMSNRQERERLEEYQATIPVNYRPARNSTLESVENVVRSIRSGALGSFSIGRTRRLEHLPMGAEQPPRGFMIQWKVKLN